MKRVYFIPLLVFLPIGVVASTVSLLWSGTTKAGFVTAGFAAVIVGTVLAYTAGLRRVAACEQCRDYVPGAARKTSGSDSGHQPWRLFLPLIAFTAFVVITGYLMAGAEEGRARTVLLAGYSITGLAGILVYFSRSVGGSLRHGREDLVVGFYADRILPHLIHLSMGQAPMAAYRQRIIPAAEGRVLEIGVGSGHNLPLYRRAASITALDPSAALLLMARRQAERAPAAVTLIEGSAEALPLETGSIDTVVTTWSLCSIPDVARALKDVRRVLTPTGRLLFIEHGRSNDAAVRRWQDRLNPVWNCVAGGCHLNRPIVELIGHAGFRIERVDATYMAGPRPMTYTFEGSARPQ